MLKRSVNLGTLAALIIFNCPLFSIEAHAQPFDSILPSIDIASSRPVLTPQENLLTYLSAIRPSYFPRSMAREKPTLRVFLGQPGSGKSSLSQLVDQQERLSDDPFHINAHDLIRHHPARSAIVGPANDAVADDQIADAMKWQQMLLSDLIESRTHIAFFSTPTDSASIAYLLRACKRTGYRIEIHVPVVSSSASELNIVERHEQTRQSGSPRLLISREFHAQVYRTLPLILATIEQNALADRVTLYREGGQIFYANRIENGQWAFPPSASTDLERERNRPVTREIVIARRERFDTLLQARLAAPGHTDQQRFDELRVASDQLLASPAPRPHSFPHLSTATINPFGQMSHVGTPYCPLPHCPSRYHARPVVLPRAAAPTPTSQGARGVIRAFAARLGAMISRVPK